MTHKCNSTCVNIQLFTRGIPFDCVSSHKISQTEAMCVCHIIGHIHRRRWKETKIRYLIVATVFHYFWEFYYFSLCG